jgi:hypothetical protein
MIGFVPTRLPASSWMSSIHVRLTHGQRARAASRYGPAQVVHRVDSRYSGVTYRWEVSWRK